jgi:glycosyltransferase involved in cell wall biosynthesis
VRKSADEAPVEADEPGPGASQRSAVDAVSGLTPPGGPTGLKKVLFVGHAADRSGAPVSLLRIARWLREHTELSFEVLLERGGELEPEFREIAPLRVARPALVPARSPLGRLANVWRRSSAGAARRAALRRELAASPPDLVFFNSLASAPLLEELGSALPCPIAGRVAELRRTWSAFGEARVRALCTRAKALVAVSRACRDDLVGLEPALAERVQVVHGFAPLRDVRGDSGRELRRCLRIPADAIVVGGAGTIGWPKGTDLFVHLARLVAARGEVPVHFVWFGPDPSGREVPRLRDDCLRLGLGERVHFPGPTARPGDHYAAFDLFVHTSRFDAFPLVCVEAAAREVPVLCFADAGGAPELVEEDAGYVVPYLDVEAMADAVAFLAGAPDERARLGKAAAEKARRRHDIDAAMPRIESLLRELLDAPAASPERRTAAPRAMLPGRARALPEQNAPPPRIAPVVRGGSRPFWSVVIPSFRPGPHLAESLRSVLDQDPGPEAMQIAVVDDASGDGVARRLVGEIAPERVELVEARENRGLAGAWNACLEHSRGRWVHLLHQDDAVRPGFYARLARADAHPEVGAAFCRHVCMDGDGVWRTLATPESPRAGVLADWLPRIAVANRLQCPAIVVRRSAFETLGGFRPALRYALDWEMWVRLAARYAFWYEPEPLALYRVHEGGETARLVGAAANVADLHRAVAIAHRALPLTLAHALGPEARRSCSRLALCHATALLLEGDVRAGLAQLRAAGREDRSLWFLLQAVRAVEPALAHAAGRLVRGAVRT